MFAYEYAHWISPGVITLKNRAHASLSPSGDSPVTRTSFAKGRPSYTAFFACP
ncbi:hypothetical protein PGR6_11060 [Pseudomonas sp. GR 6-02]|nr:hypothetical protein PGR6_11060 [Pseudomonas sp. GR 6-02]